MTRASPTRFTAIEEESDGSSDPVKDPQITDEHRQLVAELWGPKMANYFFYPGSTLHGNQVDGQLIIPELCGRRTFMIGSYPMGLLQGDRVLYRSDLKPWLKYCPAMQLRTSFVASSPAPFLQAKMSLFGSKNIEKYPTDVLSLLTLLHSQFTEKSPGAIAVWKLLRDKSRKLLTEKEKKTDGGLKETFSTFTHERVLMGDFKPPLCDFIHENPSEEMLKVMANLRQPQAEENHRKLHAMASWADRNQTDFQLVAYQHDLQDMLTDEQLKAIMGEHFGRNRAVRTPWRVITERQAKEISPLLPPLQERRLRGPLDNRHPGVSLLTRFLRARSYVVKDAFKQLKSAIEWRRSYRPLTVDCSYCTDRPGFHGMRQIGFDLSGRPVFYACFLQCQTLKNTPEDIIQHVVYLVENGFRCDGQASDKLVFVVDCTGFTLGCCNPKIGKTFVKTFGDNYPEHLGKFLLVNHNPVLNGVWKAIKVFIDPKTAQKVKLIKKDQLDQVLHTSFDAETAQWLMTEIELNRSNIPMSQLRFWEGPAGSSAANSTHDPRGAPSYVNRYIKPLAQCRAQSSSELLDRSTVGWKTHLPHPNITQQLNGTVRSVPLIEHKARNKGPSRQELNDYGVEPCESGTSTVSDDEDICLDSD